MKARLGSGQRLAAVAIAATFAVMLCTAPHALAQRAAGSSEAGSGYYVLDKATYDQVAQIQKLIGNEKYAEAIESAKTLLNRTQNGSPYAQALTYQLIAQCYLLMKNYDAAEGYLEKIVALNALQPRSQQSVIYQLATIYLSQQKYQESIRLYKQVLAQAEANKQVPDPALYYRLGLAYSFAENFQQAYHYISEGIEKRETQPVKKGEKRVPVPKEWYQNLFIVVYKQKDYDKANDIAGMLVAKWPDDQDFWRYYANTYLLLKEDDEAAAVYALMYKRGMFKDKDDYLQLVSLWVKQKAPYKAAKLLSKAMVAGVVPKSLDNYELLSSLWMQAREWDEALVALGEQAAISPSGKVYLRQASIFMSRIQYDQAVKAAHNALEKGGLEDPGLAWMILGQAAFRANHRQEALRAFHKAEDYRSQRENAQGWIKFVQSTRLNNGG